MAEIKQTKAQLRSKMRWGVVGIIAMFLAALAFIAPTQVNRAIDGVNGTVSLGIPRIPAEEFALGLDLQGGASLIYETDTSEIPFEERSSAVEGVRDVIERRVNGLGVGEPEVRTTRVGEMFRINVELPGVTDISNAIKMIGETPILEFREQNTEPPRELTPEEQDEIDAFNDDALNRINDIAKEVESAEDFATVAAERSEDEQSSVNNGSLGFVGPSTPYAELYEWASGQREGAISREAVSSLEGLNLLMRGEEREGEEQIQASHILVCYLGARGCVAPEFKKEEALAEAQRLFETANAGNFADLAREHSTDIGSGQQGGSLGSFGRGVMVPEFEGPVFAAEVGQIIGPVESPFGFHVIYKEGVEKSTEYEISRILVRTMKPSDVLPSQEAWKATGLSGSQLERAEAVRDQSTGAIQVSLQFNKEGSDLFAQLTEEHIGEPIAIFLDGVPISTPTVQTVIRNGQAVITGSFNLQDAQLLAQRLNTGAIPVPIELVSQQTVGPTLGAETLSRSLTAGMWAIILVMIFMVAYYRLPGLLSVFSLVLYISITLATFKIIGVTLTLAGIAGFILSIGMAVDANVLIFERLKEELKDGKSLKAAVEEGFLRAWTSIRDGNVSTIITCLLLITFGSSFVQGFAVTLVLGVLLSMFTAIVITRLILRFIVPWFSRYGNKFFPGATGGKE